MLRRINPFLLTIDKRFGQSSFQANLLVVVISIHCLIIDLRLIMNDSLNILPYIKHDLLGGEVLLSGAVQVCFLDSFTEDDA